MLAAIAIDALGFGIVVPVVPHLVMELGQLSEAGASSWMGYLLSAFAVMQFLCAPAARAR